MADVAAQDDGVLFKKTIFGIDLEYTKTDAAIDGALLAGGAMIGGVGAAPAAGIAAVRSGVMMLGRGILRSVFKTAAKEGAEAVAKTAAKATVEAGAKAAVKESAETVAQKTIKTKLTDANEDALAALVKAKAAGEAERAGVKAAVDVTASTAAKTAAKETAESAAGLAADAAAKTVTKEAAEATSKSLLSTAAKAGGYAWTGAKILAAPVAYPKTFLLGASAGHLLTDGATSRMIWGGYTGLWNLGKEFVPGATATLAEGALKLGDGTMGFLGTGAKMGAQGLSHYLPPGTPAPIKAALGALDVNENRTTESADSPATDNPTLRDRANKAAATVRKQAEDAAGDIDFMDAPEAKPFRAMIARQLNMDPAKVSGKELTAKLGELAKDNPLFATGMALGTAYGAMGAGKTKMERAMGAVMYGALFGFAFQILGQLYPGLLPGLTKMLGAAPDAMAKIPGAIGLDTSSLNDGFKEAAEGRTPAPTTSAPAPDQPRTPMASQFAQQAGGAAPAPAPALTPAPEDVDLRRNRPDAANSASYRMTVGAPG